MRFPALLVCAVCTLGAVSLMSCRSKRSDPAPVAATDPSVPPAPPASSAPPEPDLPPNALDALFRGYQKELPQAESLSEQNGASLKCERHGWVTYTLLDATARKLPVGGDEDLVRLARWARDPDACLRQIALERIVEKVGFDSNRLVLPSMHEPDHYLYRDIFVALLAHLDQKKVRYPSKLLTETKLDVRARDFAVEMRGEWRESTEGKNFILIVAVADGELRVTNQRTEPDPKWPDRTWAGKIKDVQVNERRRYVITAASGAEERKYAISPTSNDVMWFEEDPARWVKLRRTGG